MRVANLLMTFDRAIRVHEHNENGTSLIAPISIQARPNTKVDNSVAIEIAQTCNRTSKKIVIMQNPREVPLGVTDFLMCLDSAISVQEQEISSTTIGASIIVPAHTVQIDDSITTSRSPIEATA
ncbi:MAG: hypothetical protein R3B91_00950 [Planctomycetaceae bacterium]